MKGKYHLTLMRSPVVKRHTLPESGLCRIFTVDATAMKTGWGRALDKVYDEIAASLHGVRDLIVAASYCTPEKAAVP